MITSRRRVLGHGAALLLAPACPAWSLQAPLGEVMLTLTGKLMSPNDGAMAQFDMALLEKLPQTSFATRTPWYAQPRKFTGPLMRDVLREAGAKGSTLRVRALNDYRVDIPFEDTQRYDLIIARLLDDQPMAVRDKGPLFAIYPFDTQPELRNAVYYSRSAWQLRTIEVR